MGFFLEHNRDSALLALAIKEGQDAAAGKGRSLGRTAVQKIMYFLSVAGVPMGYRFEIHNFGPFCSEIMRDTDWLIVDDIIGDCSHTPESSNYGPGENIELLLESYEDFLKPHRETVSTIAAVFAPLQTADLELYATLDYIFREQRARGGDGPWKDRVIKRFMEIKKNKFAQGVVEKAYENMQQAELVSP